MAWLNASSPSIFFSTTWPPRSSLPSLPSFAPRRTQEPPPGSRLSLGFPDSSSKGGKPGEWIWKVKVEEDAFGMGGSSELEDEIYTFMQKSANPRDFPTKKELIAAGRADLVEAIASEGGWLTFGWGLEEGEDENGRDLESGNGYSEEDSRLSQLRFLPADGSLNADPVDTCSMASSSGRSMELEAEEDAGIEGILSRLEKERSWTSSIDVGEKEVNGRMSWRNGEHDPGDAGSIACKKTVGSTERSIISRSLDGGEDLLHDFGDECSHEGTSSDDCLSLTPNMWRMWSLQRAGNPITEFEAAEIVPDEDRKSLDQNFKSKVSMEEKSDTVTQSADEIGNRPKDPYCDAKESSTKQIRFHIQKLESELTSMRNLLRSRSNDVVSQQGKGSSLEELHRLSDALEFKETEIMNARDKLRSTRAKLAVLQGKMAREIIEAQKIMEERKKRLDAAHRALHLLRSASIVWPNSASEVLLTGSFDGWTSRRRMERSDSGIFSLHLKLYPGRYEIKFIVDGVWKIDPLRPIVHNNGHENNLLIII